MWAPAGKVKLGGSQTAVANRPGSSSLGRAWAVQAVKAISGIVLALSGAPATWN
jgi:hypothetical protein